MATSTIFQLPWKSCVNGGGGTIRGTILNIFNACPSPFAFTPLSKATTLFSNPHTLFLIILAYLTTLFTLSRFLTNSNSAHKRHTRSQSFAFIAITHNIFLSLFSLYMNIQVTRTILSTSNIADTVCIPRGRDLSNDMQQSFYIFLLSKIYELLDTVILLIRRRPLTFLHVWHHSTVPFEVWGWLDQKVSLGLYGMWFNTAVHVVMYAYYAIVLSGYRVQAKILITFSQIIQFITGFLSLIPFLFLHLSRPPGCEGTTGLLLSSVINGSYLLLFIMFYRNTYIRKKIKAHPRRNN